MGPNCFGLVLCDVDSFYDSGDMEKSKHSLSILRGYRFLLIHISIRLEFVKSER